MNARLKLSIPALGTAIEGGFFHGIHLLDGQIWGEVTSTAAEGVVSGLPWLEIHSDVPGAASDFDGLANTIAMAEAGSPLAMKVRELRIAGHDDWYIAARGGVLMQWANRKALPASEGFGEKAHWTSTQYSRYGAFSQTFGDGYTTSNDKSWAGGRARAVRRFLIE